MTTNWEHHQGQDYTVVMKETEGTDNASITVTTGDRREDLDLARKISSALNGPYTIIDLFKSMDRAKSIRDRGTDFTFAFRGKALLITLEDQTLHSFVEMLSLEQIINQPLAVDWAIDRLQTIYRNKEA